MSYGDCRLGALMGCVDGIKMRHLERSLGSVMKWGSMVDKTSATLQRDINNEGRRSLLSCLCVVCLFVCIYVYMCARKLHIVCVFL